MTIEASGGQAPRDLEPIITNLGQLSIELGRTTEARGTASIALTLADRELTAAMTDYDAETRAAIYALRDLAASGLDGAASFMFAGRIAEAAGESS